MSKRALLLGVVLIIGCGRSSMDAADLVDINVGLISQDGSPLTQAQVYATLAPFQFQLIYFATKPECTTAKSCIWWAEGAVPEQSLIGLSGYQDSVLKVVSVQRVTYNTGASTPHHR